MIKYCGKSLVCRSAITNNKVLKIFIYSLVIQKLLRQTLSLCKIDLKCLVSGEINPHYKMIIGILFGNLNSLFSLCRKLI